MTMQMPSGSMASSYPVDNPTYNLLQAATSACEAVEAYRKYAKDGDEQLFGRLAEEETRHAQQLLSALQRRLMSGDGSDGSDGMRASATGS